MNAQLYEHLSKVWTIPSRKRIWFPNREDKRRKRTSSLAFPPNSVLFNEEHLFAGFFLCPPTLFSRPAQCDHQTCTSDKILFWVIPWRLILPTSCWLRKPGLWGRVFWGGGLGVGNVCPSWQAILGWVSLKLCGGGVPLNIRKGQILLLYLTLWQNSQPCL